VLRLRLDVTQLAGLTSTTERVEVSRAGTDD
jgi:hypothetical protein